MVAERFDSAPSSSSNQHNMNKLSRKSSIKIKKTDVGQCKCGFSKTEGVTMAQAEYHAELKKNGYKVVSTANGFIISKP